MVGKNKDRITEPFFKYSRLRVLDGISIDPPTATLLCIMDGTRVTRTTTCLYRQVFYISTDGIDGPISFNGNISDGIGGPIIFNGTNTV